MGVALSFALPLTKAALGAFVHAVLPFLCTTTASDTVKGLHARMTRRCAACPKGPVHRPELFATGPRMPALERFSAFDPGI
jgi:hypothetical protein